MYAHRGIILAVLVLLILIVGMFIFTYLKKNELNEVEPTSTQTSLSNNLYSDIGTIQATHYIKDSDHVLVGTMLLPSACDILGWDVMVAESYPEQVTINFQTENYTQECIDTERAKEFKVLFTASKDAVIRVKFEGRPVTLDITESLLLEPSESLELFGTR